MVGAIIGELQNMGLLDNTYVIFTSDNGFFNGEHRMPVAKHLLYEEALRVPLVIRGPSVPAGEIRTQMVSNLDVTATVAELAGATAGRPPDGRSLVPLLTSNDPPWRTAMLLEGDDVLPEGKDIVYGYYSAVRTPDYNYAEHVNDKEVYTGNEFYDLAADPYEVDSRPDDPNYQQVIDQLKPLLASLRSCQGDTCWVAEPIAHSLIRRQARPDIGFVCRSCAHRTVSYPLEPSESDDTR
jgi:arylsulfatase A-like enzyme